MPGFGNRGVKIKGEERHLECALSADSLLTIPTGSGNCSSRTERHGRNIYVGSISPSIAKNLQRRDARRLYTPPVSLISWLYFGSFCLGDFRTPLSSTTPLLAAATSAFMVYSRRNWIQRSFFRRRNSKVEKKVFLFLSLFLASWHYDRLQFFSLSYTVVTISSEILSIETYSLPDFL